MEDFGVLQSLLVQFVGVSACVVALTELAPIFGRGTPRRRIVALFYSSILSFVVWTFGLVTLPDIQSRIAESLTASQALALELGTVVILAGISSLLAWGAHDLVLKRDTK